MVIHDEERIEAWAQERAEQEEMPQKPPRKWRLSVVGVQSIACGVIVLVALLLRVAGGEAYGTLRQRFQEALTRNEWATAVALLWDGETLENEVFADVKSNDFTEGETAQLTASSVLVTAVPPLEGGTLTSAFGERLHPIDGTAELHRGVDIAAPLGTALVAMYDGEVAEVGENDTLGKFIRMLHDDGLEIVYGHCERVTVQQGDAVTAGDEVARVGSTGVSTGSHVHLSVLVDGEVCDPAALLSLERYA